MFEGLVQYKCFFIIVDVRLELDTPSALVYNNVLQF